MKVITIRNIPDDLYRVITRLANRNRRSIQQQVLTILDRARIFDKESPVEKAREIRKHLETRELGSCVDEIREERNR
jgi:plasmid stability protein